MSLDDPREIIGALLDVTAEIYAEGLDEIKIGALRRIVVLAEARIAPAAVEDLSFEGYCRQLEASAALIERYFPACSADV